jgi:hypothetical protein
MKSQGFIAGLPASNDILATLLFLIQEHTWRG